LALKAKVTLAVIHGEFTTTDVTPRFATIYPVEDSGADSCADLIETDD
jgi:hypothetical protein